MANASLPEIKRGGSPNLQAATMSSPVLFGLLVVVWVVSAQAQRFSCPPRAMIFPCTCDGDASSLTCSDATPIHLTRVFDAIRELSPSGVIERLTLDHYSHPYIPSGLFSGLDVRDLSVRSGHLKSFFDAPSNGSSFRGAVRSAKNLDLRCMDTACDDFDWRSLDQLDFVRHLSIGGSFRAIGSALPAMPVVFLSLYRSNVESMAERAFAELSSLTHLSIQGNQHLRSLSRSQFPNPANLLRDFLLRSQEISTLPDDMFEGMPQLVHVQLPYLIEKVPLLQQQHDGVVYLQAGNGLTCDSSLKWMLRMRQEGRLDTQFSSCARPERLAGKEVRSLREEDL